MNDYSKWTFYEILADDEAVMQLTTEEWQEIEPDDEGQTPELRDYILDMIDSMRQDGISNSDDALNMAFYMRAAELLIEAQAVATQREIDEAGRYRM